LKADDRLSSGARTSGPLDSLAEEELAGTLADHPFSFGPRSVLMRHAGQSWVVGRPSRSQAAIVLSPWQPHEPAAFGEDPEAIWELLRRIPGWTCVNCSLELSERLGPVLERELKTPVRIEGDVYYTLEATPVAHSHPAVRRLTEDDLALIDAAPVALRPVGFLSTLAALSGGVVAGAVLENELVGLVSMTVSTEDFADVGAAVLAPWRNRGIGSAAAYLVAQGIRERGLTPVWSTGERNAASRRVAEKVGFREFGRKAYVVSPRLEAAGGFRPPAAA
jgi:GNAT superfamily N-acetyltransferase